MIRSEDLLDLKTAAPDYDETERLKREFRLLRETRFPFFLDAAELEPIFKWKLGSQYKRGLWQRSTNSNSAYRIATRATFEVQEEDFDYEIELRFGFLTSLRGVGIPVASAILALVEPSKYCVIDFRGWRLVFGERRDSFGIGHYKRYLGRVRELSIDLGWSPQETDLAIWELDRRVNTAV